MIRRHLSQAVTALRLWSTREWLIGLGAAVAVGLALGAVTVLIPNPVFGRAIAPLAWNYPVWLVTALLSGLLIASYVRPAPRARSAPEAAPTEKSSVWAMAGAFGSWFAIGCPVCNKLALLALGYSGAISYFGPLQPWLAAISLVLLSAGLVVRLSGTVACVLPAATRGPADRASLVSRPAE